MGIEFELKYQADPESREKILLAYPGEWKTISMETTYYDTPARTLSARRWTLRRRLENGVPVCTLKTPAGAVARGEWELECDRVQAAIPGLCAMGCPRELEDLAAGGLVPICGTRFTRQARLLALDGAVVELALDAGVLIGGDRELPLGEVEVELKSGAREAAEAFARTLAQAFGLTPEPLSKFARAGSAGKQFVTNPGGRPTPLGDTR